MGAWVKRYRVALCMAYFVALGVITTLAALSAIDVQNGGSAGTLSKAFGYQADLVMVCPASTADEKKYQWLAGKKVYLLGETAQSAVLYLPYTDDFPYTDETIQVPIAAVIISSSTYPTSRCNGATTSS